MYRLVRGSRVLVSIRQLQMTVDEGGAIGDYWLVTELEDGPPLGFGAPEVVTTIFGGAAAQERANNYLKLVEIEQEDINGI